MRVISIILILFSILAGQTSSTVYFTDGFAQTVSNKSNRWLLIGGILGTGIASKYDNRFNDYAQANGLMPNQMAKFGDYWGIGGELLLWGALLTSENKNEKFKYASTAFVANGLLTYGLKFGVGRNRPNGKNNRSFPSGHTSNSFLTATIAQEIFGPKIGIPAYILAGITGMSRIHDNEHYLSDVIFGAVLGTAIGRGFGQVYKQNDSPIVGIVPQSQHMKIYLVWPL
ncbi:MAG: phosphatase PAP2 family protein [Candidatus Marinimicrobia bacterium]|nr:phosphatase PAP2 family protein [Candidatus Neomarinimicrobiota bacterium]MBL7009664.1 phosphatase PAP2 family protein [Candidatus Neomarinimicrobiota bacterium]MBL7029593.1 phosphatase PAP2 family protein [Candidatus Neomarinimicrobiota bacterium]